MTGTRARRESFAEKRERHAAVDDPAVVLEAAARFLEVRSRSVSEVRRRLGGAGYRSDLVEGAIARMTELGMLDDEAFARTWVESRDRARPRGERAIREELRLKGIDRETVDLVLGERRDRAIAADAEDGSDGMRASADRTAAERLLAKNARALARVADPRQRRQRAYALLARHGFDPETCRDVAATLAEFSGRRIRVRNVPLSRVTAADRDQTHRTERLRPAEVRRSRAIVTMVRGPRRGSRVDTRPRVP